MSMLWTASLGLSGFQGSQEGGEDSNTWRHINCMLCLFCFAGQACPAWVDHAIMLHASNFVSANIQLTSWHQVQFQQIISQQHLDIKQTILSNISRTDLGLCFGMGPPVHPGSMPCYALPASADASIACFQCSLKACRRVNGLEHTCSSLSSPFSH